MNRLEGLIPNCCQGMRLDKALSSMFGDYSRTTLQTWVVGGQVWLDGKRPLKRMIVKGGEQVVIEVPESLDLKWDAQDIPLDVVFEDESVIVVNKVAGMVVHPGAGNWQDTLLNALLQHDSSLKQLPRAGIVHRLDKNTSGLLVVARTEQARMHLNRQFKKRTASRRYVAIVEGRLIAGGTIDAAIGRHQHDRRRMIVGEGKNAVSHYRIVSRFRMHSVVRVQLETGRTHQIRVHFRHAGFPLIGDPEYGTRAKIPAGATQELATLLCAFRRQALHAELLEIDHPDTGERCHWHQGVPQDMRNLIIALKRDADDHAATKNKGMQ